jgi:hypothetical protein
MLKGTSHLAAGRHDHDHDHRRCSLRATRHGRLRSLTVVCLELEINRILARYLILRLT